CILMGYFTTPADFRADFPLPVAARTQEIAASLQRRNTGIKAAKIRRPGRDKKAVRCRRLDVGRRRSGRFRSSRRRLSIADEKHFAALADLRFLKAGAPGARGRNAHPAAGQDPERSVISPRELVVERGSRCRVAETQRPRAYRLRRYLLALE